MCVGGGGGVGGGWWVGGNGVVLEERADSNLGGTISTFFLVTPCINFQKGW